jgi:hypothetical protein
MAEIRIERKGRGLGWLWLFLALVVVAVLAWYFLYPGRTTTAPAPAPATTGALPSAERGPRTPTLGAAVVRIPPSVVRVPVSASSGGWYGEQG